MNVTDNCMGVFGGGVLALHEIRLLNTRVLLSAIDWRE